MSGIFSARNSSDLAKELNDAASRGADKLIAGSTPDLARKLNDAAPRGADKLIAGSTPDLAKKLNDAASRGADKFTVLEATVRFKGELVADEDLMIQGQIEGSIEQKASHLTIGSKGIIKADINANHVIVQGEVIGDLYATEAVIVEASARVRGNIFAPRVTLKDGAQFKGSIDMGASGDTSIMPQPKAETSSLAALPASTTTGKSGSGKL